MGSPVFELLARFIFVAVSFMIACENAWVVAVLKGQCIDSERAALLIFKQGFHNHSDNFLPWVAEEDCCKWIGVGCNNMTGHVITLDLHSQDSFKLLQGQLSESLLDLPFLSYLDLSGNDFHQTQIPEFIGSLSNLKYLNLSDANFRGDIPSQLGNLSSLQSLDLSTGKSYALRASTLHWLSGLFSLKILALNGVYLSNVVHWLDAVNKLPLLVKLHLSNCQLHNLPQSIPSFNFTVLEFLDLSYNSFYSMTPNWLVHISPSLRYLNLKRCELIGSIPQTFANFTSLVVLDLSYNRINGSIPYNVGNMTSLDVLDLSNNQLEGPIPATLGLIQKLRELHLSNNKLDGSVETILPQLSELVVLDVAFNDLNGVISEDHLQNFSSLQVLDLSANQLILNVSPNWIPDFQLEIIGLRSCQMGPQFPQWLQNQKKCLQLDMRNTNLSGYLPNWFWDLSPSMELLDLSWNRLRGELPNLSTITSLLVLALNGNQFKGNLPHFPSKIKEIVLNGNQFSGSISPICDMMNENNVLNYLGLYENLLSGSLPNCWKHGKNLFYLNLGSNKFSGQIPDSIGHLFNLKSLYLSDNNFSGEIPQSLQNCKNLIALALDHNSLSGSIPTRLGENMQYLLLSNNAFQGNIPLQLCQLRKVLILDISSNSLSGRIPPCINSFLPMADEQAQPFFFSDWYAEDKINQQMWIQSQHQNKIEYSKLLDLSSNRLSGEIPREVTKLIRLHYLNLSNNHLVGRIPCNIGAMKSLKTLDLSRNQLSHTIPPTISNLRGLEELNLSYNNLSGKVPTRNYFSSDSFKGNHNLCGTPLSSNCSMDGSFEEETECSTNSESTKQKNDEIQDEETPSFYISLPIGYAMGFLGFLATLVFNKSWRHAYFRFLDNMGDKICIFLVASNARLRRKFHKELAL